MQHAGQADRLASRSVSRPHTESWHGCAGPPCLLSACTEFQIFATKLGDISDMTRYSLDELRQRYVVEGRPLEASLEEVLRADTRAGARAILASVEKRRFENRSEGQRLRKILRFETLLWDQGLDAVAGVDEAGMSPLAGPVSAAAVILKPGTRITGIDDSKRLDSNSREALAKEIKEKAAAWSVAFVEVEEIDTINIYWAGILAMRRAVEGLRIIPQLERDGDPAAGDYQGR
jgi:ribonuclease HII